MKLTNSLGVWTHVTSKAFGKLQRLQEMGADYVVVKVADGAHAYHAADCKTLCVEALHLGMPVVAWAYVYPRNIPATIAALADAVPPGCTDLVLDAETEWEGVPNAAKLADDLCHKFAVATGHRVSLHLSSLYAPSLHPQIPYEAFLSHCVSFMPQSYQELSTPAALVVQRTDAQAKPLAAKALGKAIIPTVNTPAMLTALHGRGYTAQSIWLLDGVYLPAGKKRGDGEDMGILNYESLWEPAMAPWKEKG